MKKIALNDAQAVASRISGLTPFETYGNLSGSNDRESGWAWGALSGSARARFRDDAPTIDYVLRSYSTPIAWHTPESGWFRVDRYFSMSTRKAQSRVSYGISVHDDKRVTVLQPTVRLSPAQGELLYRAVSERRAFQSAMNGSAVAVRAGRINEPRGSASRTVAALLKLDLIEVDAVQGIRATDKGVEVYA